MLSSRSLTEMKATRERPGLPACTAWSAKSPGSVRAGALRRPKDSTDTGMKGRAEDTCRHAHHLDHWRRPGQWPRIFSRSAPSVGCSRRVDDGTSPTISQRGKINRTSPRALGPTRGGTSRGSGERTRATGPREGAGLSGGAEAATGASGMSTGGAGGRASRMKESAGVGEEVGRKRKSGFAIDPYTFTERDRRKGLPTRNKLGATSHTHRPIRTPKAVQAGGPGLSRPAFISGALRELSDALCRGNASLCRSGAHVTMRASSRTRCTGLPSPLPSWFGPVLSPVCGFCVLGSALLCAASPCLCRVYAVAPSSLSGWQLFLSSLSVKVYTSNPPI
jgi:hypothetical protein